MSHRFDMIFNKIFYLAAPFCGITSYNKLHHSLLPPQKTGLYSKFGSMNSSKLKKPASRGSESGLP